MNNMKYLFLGIILIVAVAVYFVLQPSLQTEQQPQAANSPATASASESGVAGAPFPSAQPAKPQPEQVSSAEQEAVRERYPEIAERLDTMQQRRPNRYFNPEAVAAAVKRDTAWTPAEEPPEDLPLTEEEMTDGRQFIQFDSLKLETLMPGDAMTVFVEDSGENYRVVVDRVEKHDYNSITWHGHIDGRDGHTYDVSFTRGDTLTVGGMGTPDGHYVLQAHGDDGWIASSGLLFKYDPDVPDVMYPHDEEGHPIQQ